MDLSAHTRFVLIGISDSATPALSAQALSIIARGQVFSGGKRHREIVAHLIPQGAVWIDITVPLSQVFVQYCAYEEVIVFASGDPLFYGFGGTIRRQMPQAEIRVYPHFNSLQTLAHRLCMPYEDMHAVSLTGRPWRELDIALIERRPKIGLLTDHKHTPAAIASRLLDYGFGDYRMAIGELLGNDSQERVSWYDLSDAVHHQAMRPNAVILYTHTVRPRPLGIPESEFALLNDRSKMITKAPIRLATLSALNIRQANVMWDVGFCTASVSIEAKMQCPTLEVIAFEIRPEGHELIHANAKRFGVPGIEYHIGDFLSQDLDVLPRPDIIFIGGHGGRIVDFVERSAQYIKVGGRIGINAVSTQSYETFVAAVTERGWHIGIDQCIRLDEYNPIRIVVAKAE